MDFRAALTEALEANNLSLEPAAFERMSSFYELLAAASEVMNLTAIKEPGSSALLNFTDSLLASRFIPEGARVIDIGCGAGFPCVPLAIARPDLSIVALDATAKKIDFIKSSAASCGISNIEAISGRAEELAALPEHRERFDIAISRAVARLNILAELTVPFIRGGGRLVALKGPAGAEELREAEHALSTLGCGAVDSTGNGGCAEYELIGREEKFSRSAIIVQKLRSTARIYPRKYAKINKSPL